MACSIARTWAVIGEPWTPLILRDLTLGLNRFDDLVSDLGISTNVLAARLRILEQEEVIERRAYSDNGRQRDEYHLTASGEALVPILVAITGWGDTFLATDGPPAVFHHATCDTVGIRGVVICSECGEPVTAQTATALPGPGARVGPGTHRIAGAAPPP